MMICGVAGMAVDSGLQGKKMIDWNNNGKIDPEELFLTEEILGEDTPEENPHKFSGCLLSLITLPFLIILKGLNL